MYVPVIGVLVVNIPAASLRAIGRNGSLQESSGESKGRIRTWFRGAARYGLVSTSDILDLICLHCRLSVVLSVFGVDKLVHCGFRSLLLQIVH